MVEMPEDRNLSRRERQNQKQKKGKKITRILSNILLFVGVIGMVTGSGIIGYVLWGEYNRSVEKKVFLEEAQSIVQPTSLISRDQFNPQDADTAGILSLPEYDVNVAIKEGVSEASLHSAVGHQPETHWPGDGKQVFLAGHRNTDFGVLEHVKQGDTIRMTMPYGTYDYKITMMEIVNQRDVHVIKPNEEFPNDQLVLMTCYPFTFGADTEERYLVYAERVVM